MADDKLIRRLVRHRHTAAFTEAKGFYVVDRLRDVAVLVEYGNDGRPVLTTMAPAEQALQKLTAEFEAENVSQEQLQTDFALDKPAYERLSKDTTAAVLEAMESESERSAVAERAAAAKASEAEAKKEVKTEDVVTVVMKELEQRAAEQVADPAPPGNDPLKGGELTVKTEEVVAK